MKSIFRSTLSVSRLFGFDPAMTVRAICGLPPYIRDWRALRRQAHISPHPIRFGRPYPCLADRYEQSGTATGHYFHQDLLVAQRIFAESPKSHVDVGSRVDGFVAHVASFRKIRVLDIRTITAVVPNIEFLRGDLMGDLSEEHIGCSDSVSCLHTIEHFGLGRYGDPICFDGYLRGIENLFKMVTSKGTLYLSTPIGSERIEFNAHRVFSVNGMSKVLSNFSTIRSFSYVDDHGDLHQEVSHSSEQASRSFGCSFGCGIWECIKD